MPDTVRCSECDRTFAARGFGSHNASMHGGDAEPAPVDGDDEPADDPPTAGDGGDDEPDDPVPDDALDAALGDGGGGDEPDAGGDEPDGDHGEAFADEDNEVEGDPEAGDMTDEVEDDEDDSRYPYQCGNCGHGLEYLGGDDRDGGGKKCPECDERLYWSRVDA